MFLKTFLIMIYIYTYMEQVGKVDENENSLFKHDRCKI